MRILVAEDESRMAELPRQGLSEEGHSATIALNGQSACSLAQSCPFNFDHSFQTPGAVSPRDEKEKL
jgi:DNA-binding response OmpR family regulator